MRGNGIEVEGISRCYGNQVALENLSLSVEAGEICGFVGPNGAGKTTAMRIIVGLLDADDGVVHWDGAPIGETWRRRIGYMPEERGLYPKMRVDQQLEYFGELHGLSAGEAREQATRWLERLGVSERREDNVEALSLGNQQRVQLAASLVFEPELLVLDEPFSGLDPVGVDVLGSVLTEVCYERQVPVLFSSHQLDLVERLCDSVAIIKDGRLIAAGRVEDLEDERAGNLWCLRLGGPPDDWDPELPGVTRRSAWNFELDSGVDPGQLLERGLAAGEVVEYRRLRPGLAELFRASIGEGEPNGTQR